MQLPLIPIRQAPFNLIFRKRWAYALQINVTAKKHSLLRQVKPWITIWGIIYLHHFSVYQWNHYFTTYILKKVFRKLNATWLSLLPYYPNASSKENGRCYRQPRKYKTQQKIHLTYMQQQSPEPQTVTKSERLRRTIHMTFILVGEEMQDKSSRRSWACSYTVCSAE